MNINGVEHEARSLTLPEVRKLRKQADEDEGDILAIAWSYGILRDEAAAWFNGVPAGTAAKALAVVFEVSGLTEGAQFPG